LTYGPDEAELATEIKKDAVLREHLIGGLSIKEMASLLLELSILITMDTGITHLGACFKIPTVCVYEDRNFDKCKGQWYPWKTRHINIKHSKMIKTENVDWSDIKAMIR